MNTKAVRSSLVAALRDDLIGPDPDASGGAAHATETLSSSPSTWYLAGFLAPTTQRVEDKQDEDADDGMDSALAGADEGEPDSPPARRPVFPSSIGLTVLVHRDAKSLKVRITYGTYTPIEAPARPGRATRPQRPPTEPPPAEGSAVAAAPRPATEPPPSEGEHGSKLWWVREPNAPEVTVTLDGDKSRIEPPLPPGIVLRVERRAVPESEHSLVPEGAQYVTLFLINRRAPVDKPKQDAGYIFQVCLHVACSESFLPRPNPRGTKATDEPDEQIGDLQYRDAFEYAVGHGVSASAKVIGRGGDVFCHEVATAWMPEADVEKVEPSELKDQNIELGMEALAALGNRAAVRAAVGGLVPAYRAWIELQQAKVDAEILLETRQGTAKSLLAAAGLACGRIDVGIGVLENDDAAFEAFQIANRVMAAAAWQRSGEGLRAAKRVPTWRPFQLAFVLMNLAAQVEPKHEERDAVDLIFFPTGGGKTEAYLGLAAFVLALRRLKNPGTASAGVTILMRYTLRLLTLDQLERAATLICALERERRLDPAKLGPQRFSIGLWVGKAATPNRFGTEKDRDETTARNRVLAFRKDSKSPSPIPIDKCPWCATAFGQDTFDLKPNSQTPQQLRVICTNPRCEFRWRKDAPEGLPVLAVDEEIYRELPCFLIATVDKFAGLPWTGKTGLLLGRDVTHANAIGFFGPGQKPQDARPLATPLLPPDLIIQDELHLISGPLGTMVGLYETAIDHLTTRLVDGKSVRPKIVASTATVRRAGPQIRALFGRTRVDVFPPPGPDRRTSFFAETVPTHRVPGRRYVGLAAPGRSQKVLLMRTYIALLSAAQRAYDEDPASADPYMTLVGYFNSLRELGGSRRIVEDEVRRRLLRVAERHRVNEPGSGLANRTIELECVELTSRASTNEVKIAKERLNQEFTRKTKGRAPVDVAVASNMISVGLDIQRLGLMVACGQPKTTSEYIQATSRVGRDDKRPGLVVTLLNVHKPRDRSHYEHFTAFHESFYRGVEATSVTPFSPRAIDRGLAGVVVALARLGEPRLTAADSAEDMESVRRDLGFVGDVFASRAEAHRGGHPDDEPIDELKTNLRHRIDALFDSWARVAMDEDHKGEGLAYQRYEEGQSSKRALLHMPLDPELLLCDKNERQFVANRSMRDVEETVDVYVTKLKESAIALEDAGEGGGGRTGR